MAQTLWTRALPTAVQRLSASTFHWPPPRQWYSIVAPGFVPTQVSPLLAAADRRRGLLLHPTQANPRPRLDLLQHMIWWNFLSLTIQAPESGLFRSRSVRQPRHANHRFSPSARVAFGRCGDRCVG